MVLRKLFKLLNKKNDTLPIKKEKNRDKYLSLFIIKLYF